MTLLYIESPPDNIRCIYCGSACAKEVMYETIVEYTCHNHGEAEVMFRCASHSKTTWFFNVIKVTRGNWRISWNFYSGRWAQIEKLVPAEDKKWGSHWKLVHNIFADFIYSPIGTISSYLNLYRVFS
jgi:predicted RNA-binding Zn-ribbon protein involved in translation (DUF1610 family)